MKVNNILVGLIILAFICGYLVGAFTTYVLVQKGIENILTHIRVESVSIGFNETYIMDRFNQTIQGAKP